MQNEFSWALDLQEETYLSHHGILGMKWGITLGPPYPLGSNAHSSAQKKAAKSAGIKVGSSSGKGSIANLFKKKKPVQQAAPKQQPKEPERPETPEEHKAKREAAIKSGNPNEIRKYRDELTNDELQKALNRVSLNKQLAAIDVPPSAFDKIDKAMKTVDKITNWVGTGIKVYNTAATVHNSFSDKDSQWKKLDGNPLSNKDKKK